jgi:hypothetical protein
MTRRPWWKEGLALLICIIHVLPFYILLTTSLKELMFSPFFSLFRMFSSLTYEALVDNI